MSVFAADSYGLYVGGEWGPTDESYERHNPAQPWEVTGRYSVAGPEDVAAAYAAARAAAPPWRRRPAAERAEILFRASELIAERCDELGAALTSEEGKPLTDARGEAARAAAIFRYFAGECSQPMGEVYPSSSSRFLYTKRVPLGVVCAITPWNFPLAIPAWKIAPALAYGNAVVWKPAELTPHCAIKLTQMLIEAGLPAGVLNLVTGPAGRISDALLNGDALAALTFTGSNEVGQQIKSALCGRNVKIQLELGGKNAAVVLADADLDLAASEIAKAAMRQTGQRCTATSRVLVDRTVADELLDRLVVAIAALRVGDPADLATDVGPLASRAQFTKMLEHLEQVHRLGLEIVYGGRATDPDRGYFVDPTVVVDPRGDSRVSREEIFGPLVCFTPVEDATVALERANDTPYGLSASVFTSSLDHALAFVDGLDAGVVHVNGESTGAEPHVPFGGMKDSSSFSREQGKASREFFTQLKTVYVHGPTATP